MLVTTFSVAFTGCAPSRPFYFFDDGNLSHYKGAATEIEYPDVNTVVVDDEILPAATSVTNDANARCASRLVPRTVRGTCLETLVTVSRGNWTINSQAPGRRSRSEPFMPGH